MRKVSAEVPDGADEEIIELGEFPMEMREFTPFQEE